MHLADCRHDLAVENTARKANTMRVTEPRAASNATHEDGSGTLRPTKVIGCGNVYAGDDAVGPLVISRLQAAGLPGYVACFDAGTSGIDAALAFRDASEVIVIDACRSGHPPGTIFELNQQEIASLKEAARPNFHTLRWDQAIAVADQFCQPAPTTITVFLVEGQNFSLGDAVTPAVADAVEELAVGLLSRLQQPAHGSDAGDRLADQVAQQLPGAT
jgi:hydrogenase maturation protease